MTTKAFLELLGNNPQKELVFEYEANQFIPVYHITEVKNIYFESIDCGGNAHEEFQTITQLWISPKDFLEKKCMTAEKALKIFNIVDKKKPLLQDTPIFFEYGDDTTATSVYQVDSVKNEINRILVKMSVPATVCKPRELLNLVQNTVQNTVEKATGCCGPGTGCC